MFSTFFTVTIAILLLFILSIISLSLVCDPPIALSLLCGFLGVLSIGMLITSYIIFMTNY